MKSSKEKEKIYFEIKELCFRQWWFQEQYSYEAEHLLSFEVLKLVNTRYIQNM